MKRLLYAFAVIALCVLPACQREGEEDIKGPKSALTGAWELSDITTKANFGSVAVTVFIDFASDGTFSLYQKIGEGRYAKFTGTFALEDGSLSGRYSNGINWGPYSAQLENTKLTLTTASGSETDVYIKIDAIPSTVTSNVY